MLNPIHKIEAEDICYITEDSDLDFFYKYFSNRITRQAQRTFYWAFGFYCVYRFSIYIKNM